MRQPDRRAYPLVQEALDQGFLASGATYTVKDIPDHAAANEARLSVGRALTANNLARAVWVADSDGVPCNPLKTPCKDESAKHQVCFRLISKTVARAFIVQQSGGDPSKMKYNPFEQRKPKGVNDDGSKRE